MSKLELESSVRCGITLPGLGRDAALHQARRAESLGFDSLWVTDHVAFHVPIPESLTLLSFAAAVTERITLGTSIYLLPLRPPVFAAKAVATLDRLSGGRLVLGLGIGGEFPAEFEAVGVPVGERGPRMDEAIPLLRRLWTERDVEHRGSHFSFGAVTLDPPPVQPGGPPLWVGGRSAAALRRAGRLGDGFLSHMVTPDRFARDLDTIGRHAAEAGRDGRPFATAAYLFTVIDESIEAAHARASEVLGRLYQQPFEDAARRYCLLGRPEDCLEQMRAYARAGVRHFVMAPLGDLDAWADSAAESILPELGALI